MTVKDEVLKCKEQDLSRACQQLKDTVNISSMFPWILPMMFLWLQESERVLLKQELAKREQQLTEQVKIYHICLSCLNPLYTQAKELDTQAKELDFTTKENVQLRAENQKLKEQVM